MSTNTNLTSPPELSVAEVIRIVIMRKWLIVFSYTTILILVLSYLFFTQHHMTEKYFSGYIHSGGYLTLDRNMHKVRHSFMVPLKVTMDLLREEIIPRKIKEYSDCEVSRFQVFPVDGQIVTVTLIMNEIPSCNIKQLMSEILAEIELLHAKYRQGFELTIEKALTMFEDEAALEEIKKRFNDPKTWYEYSLKEHTVTEYINFMVMNETISSPKIFMQDDILSRGNEFFIHVVIITLVFGIFISIIFVLLVEFFTAVGRDLKI